MKYIETLIKFRDLKITAEQFISEVPTNFNVNFEIVIEVCNCHLIKLLEQYIKNYIKENELIKWVNIIWFSDYYNYCDSGCDSIASVMSELEELDELNCQLTVAKARFYIEILKQNKEI